VALRVLYALAGLVLAYGAAHGIALYNLVFDIGLVLIVLAAAVGYRAERSLRGAWAALLVFCAFFAWIGLNTIQLPDCPEARRGCLARPGARAETVAALVGVVAGIVLALLDIAGWWRRRPHPVA
jgi:uncharacterized membrane protein